MSSKLIIYSALPRLWGNEQANPIPNGTLQENGSGKLSAWDSKALNYVKELGCTHLWLIGILEHATGTAFGEIAADPSCIVKGIAGSPYAVKDYYDIAPELADDTERRMAEFEALITRCHHAGLKVIIDFIPNHVARTYHSDVMPSTDFGLSDDSNVHFSPENNFYYFPTEALKLPFEHQTYSEYPARATGNDSFSPYPSTSDWYETVKLNYGVDYLGHKAQFSPIPDTWHKMEHILSYWAEKGVDGFRCDMAEMVPPEFWAWVLPRLKAKYPLIFLAEIYQPHRYKDYLNAGFDYLYDKVGVYDTLKGIVRGEVSADEFDRVRDAVGEHQQEMCYFLENHDEQRFCSPFFAGSLPAIYPALATLVLSGTNPYLHYFGGEIGERGMEAEGFSGCDGRTSIFDYWTVESIHRLRSDYSGTRLTAEERKALAYHRQILQLSRQNKVLSEGAYYGLNFLQSSGYNRHRVLSYLRYIKGESCVLLVANFSAQEETAHIQVNTELLNILGIQDNSPLQAEDLLNHKSYICTLSLRAPYQVHLAPYGVAIIQLSKLI